MADNGMLPDGVRERDAGAEPVVGGIRVELVERACAGVGALRVRVTSCGAEARQRVEVAP